MSVGMMKKFSCLFLIGFFYLSGLKAQQRELDLDQNWQFKQSGRSQWYPAQVPGNVFVDLYQNRQIADPFFADNEKGLQWVEAEDWEYKSSFKLDSTWYKYGHQELLFEGLDTYAKVFLNDSLILDADNMFRTWTVDVKGLVRIGTNDLRLVFASAVKKGKEEAKKIPYTLPEGERVFSRKAQFQYGWDFGPRFAGCGIWKTIKLKAWNALKINSWQYALTQLSDSLAELNFIVETQTDQEQSLTYDLKYSNSDAKDKSKKKISKKVALHKGLNSDTLVLRIKNPSLWWCNGLGAASMYYFNLTLSDGKTTFAEKVLPVGIRSIELIQDADSLGRSFYFKLNGRKVFMKGANYIPSDIFLRQKPLAETEEQIKVYKSANINMLRVWGGGVYADDHFMEACDKNGILVWQDFMFACAMYPGDAHFLNSVKEEVKDQLLRLRNHPSLALWCGNNEIEEAWYNWGWQKQFKYSKNDSAQIWSHYTKVFHELIPQSIKEFNPQSIYWPSSPSIGWGHAESLKQGDSHYWGIWWGMQPFKNYENKVGRFMSEYGFQSMPSLASFKKFTARDELSLNSVAVKAHQKHKSGFETIQHYLKEEYKTPVDFSRYVYVSQLVQRDGMRRAIEAHRANKPSCMGTLFWQLNDCWPGISWSALDYEGGQKAFFYELKRLYKNHLVSVTHSQDQIRLHVISDSIHAFTAELVLKLKNFKSELVWEKRMSVTLNPETVQHLSINKKDLPHFDTSAVYLQALLIKDSTVFARTNFYFTSAKNLKLLKAKFYLKKLDDEQYELSSDVFVKDVCLYDEEQNVLLSENFFDLEAGQVKRIKLEHAGKFNSTIVLKFMYLLDGQ